MLRLGKTLIDLVASVQPSTGGGGEEGAARYFGIQLVSFLDYKQFWACGNEGTFRLQLYCLRPQPVSNSRARFEAATRSASCSGAITVREEFLPSPFRPAQEARLRHPLGKPYFEILNPSKLHTARCR
jgi:hypothetical protein